MSKWMKVKIAIGAIVGIFVILVIVLLINIGRIVNSKYEQHNINEQVKNNRQIVNNKMNIDDDIAEIVRQTAIKNNKWDYLPLSKSFYLFWSFCFSVKILE